MPSRPRRLDPRRVALFCGVVFIPAGLVKFVFHHWELHAFHDFDIPAAGVMEVVVGVLETVGGVLLLAGVLIVPTAVVLAVIMLVAFIAGGIIHGSAIPSDTLAPLLLVLLIDLLWEELRAWRAGGGPTPGWRSRSAAPRRLGPRRRGARRRRPPPRSGPSGPRRR